MSGAVGTATAIGCGTSHMPAIIAMGSSELFGRGHVIPASGFAKQSSVIQMTRFGCESSSLMSALESSSQQKPSMPKGPRGVKRPADVIGNAIKVMRIATGQEIEKLETDLAKNAAAELGRRGGKARAARMTP
jgi:hypothetical protein